MMRRRAFLVQAICGGAAVSALGCGSILHPERVRSHHSRDLDWKVVALDGLGLMLFFIPGVVAFIVDFYTGAIYLPPETHVSHRPSLSSAGGPTGDAAQQRSVTEDANFAATQGEVDAEAMRTIVLPREQLDQVGIERAVGKEIGYAISLRDRFARVSPLEKRHDYFNGVQRHTEDGQYGMTTQEFFRSIERRG